MKFVQVKNGKKINCLETVEELHYNNKIRTSRVPIRIKLARERTRLVLLERKGHGFFKMIEVLE